MLETEENAVNFIRCNAKIYNVSIEYIGSIIKKEEWYFPLQCFLYDIFKGYTYSTNFSITENEDSIKISFVVCIANQRMSNKMLAQTIKDKIQTKFEADNIVIDTVKNIQVDLYKNTELSLDK